MNLFNIPSSVWKKAREKALSLIRKDASSNIFQNNKRNFRYSSKGEGVGWRKIKGKSVYIESYEKMKRGGMNIPGYGKLKRYEGVATDRGSEGYVNMKLTGETLRRISTKNLTRENGFKIIYANGEIVEGNSKRGYVIDDLRDKNMNTVVNIISERINHNIRKYTNDKKKFTLG